MSSGVLSVAPEVATLLGPAVTARVLQQRADMTCCSCRTEIDLDAGDDASAVVEHSDQTIRIVCAHSTCMASQVIGDAPSGVFPLTAAKRWTSLRRFPRQDRHPQLAE